MNFNEFEESINREHTKKKFKDFKEAMMDERRECLRVLHELFQSPDPNKELLAMKEAEPERIEDVVAGMKEVMEDMFSWIEAVLNPNEFKL